MNTNTSLVIGFLLDIPGELLQVIKGWDQGILGGDGVPPMLAGT